MFNVDSFLSKSSDNLTILHYDIQDYEEKMLLGTEKLFIEGSVKTHLFLPIVMICIINVSIY